MPDDAREPNDPSPEEVEARLRRLLEEPTEIQLELPEPPSDDEIRAKLGRIEDRLDDVRNTDLPDMPVIPKPKTPHYDQFKAARAKQESGYDGIGVGLSVAYMLVGFPAAGLFLGYLADTYLQTDPGGKAFGCIGGAALGLWFTIKTLDRTQNRR